MDEPRTVQGPQAAGGVLKDLTSVRVFARVVELGSFSEAARRMGITPATVSKHVASLESTLRARLINRTTRRLYVTDAGHRLYERCVRVLNELDAAESELAEIRGEPAGPLRVTAPLLFALAKISPHVPRFLQRYPRVTLDFDLSIEKLDLLQERIDGPSASRNRSSPASSRSSWRRTSACSARLPNTSRSVECR